MAVLEQVSGDLAGTVTELKKDVTVIGRLPECDIILTANGVSRKHAELRKVGPSFFAVDLDSRNKTFLNDAELKGGVEQILKENDRIRICDVEFVYHPVFPPPKKKDPEPAADVITITDGDARENSDFRTLEASRSSTMASTVRPEVKLKAILEITRSLSNELRIDAVAPKILDSLLEIFPGAERLFLMLQDPVTKRLVRKAFKHRIQKRTSFNRTVPEDEVPTSISRSIVDFVLGQKKAVLSQDAGEDKNLPSSASISDLKIRSVMCVPLLTPDNRASVSSSSTPATAASSTKTTSMSWRPSRARRRFRSRTRRARVAAGTRATQPRPENCRAGAEAILTARRAYPIGVRVLCSLPADLPGRG